MWNNNVPSNWFANKKIEKEMPEAGEEAENKRNPILFNLHLSLRDRK